MNFNSNDGSSVGSSDSVEVMLVLVEASDVGTGNLVCALIVGGIVSQLWLNTGKALASVTPKNGAESTGSSYNSFVTSY